MMTSWCLDGFHLEMVFLANLGVNLHVCLCGDLQVASAQTLDLLDIGQKSSSTVEHCSVRALREKSACLCKECLFFLSRFLQKNAQRHRKTIAKSMPKKYLWSLLQLR
ncbi:hypothetical protein TRIP_B200573 [uncultured Desulfatiglans sp.]|nr:hypothetical protein TRIP_B200573 [uncultured Desulfatiglans sp.]